MVIASDIGVPTVPCRVCGVFGGFNLQNMRVDICSNMMHGMRVQGSKSGPKPLVILLA